MATQTWVGCLLEASDGARAMHGVDALRTMEFLTPTSHTKAGVVAEQRAFARLVSACHSGLCQLPLACVSGGDFENQFRIQHVRGEFQAVSGTEA